MILTEKQKATLPAFADRRALSCKQLSVELNIDLNFAKLRIAELYDKGLLKKVNQTQYQASFKGEEQIALLKPAAPAEPEVKDDDERPMTDAEMDKLLDSAFEQVVDDYVPGKPVSDKMTLDDFAALQDEKEVKAQQDEPVVEQVQEQAATHPALAAVSELKERLSKPAPIQIEDLNTKKEVLIQLARILDQSISDVLVEVCDDLERATGKQI